MKIPFCDSWIEWLLCKLFMYRDIIKEVNGVPTLYLRRWFIFKRWKRFKIFLHKIARSDEDRDPHDHPWDFTVIPLKNGYFDEQWRWGDVVIKQYTSPGGGDTTWFDQKKIYERHEPVRPWRWYKRKAEHIHRVQLDRGTAWSLVLRGPRRRNWNFVTENGYVPWQVYLNLGVDYETKDIDAGIDY